jgi:Na+/glutamate symporter
MVMIALPIFVLAAVVGVVLAAIDGPYAHDRKLIERISALILGASSTVIVAVAALVVRDSLLD